MDLINKRYFWSYHLKEIRDVEELHSAAFVDINLTYKKKPKIWREKHFISRYPLIYQRYYTARIKWYNISLGHRYKYRLGLILEDFDPYLIKYIEGFL